EEVLQYVQEEEVAFIHLTFCDVFGRQKNISIVPSELSRAFEYGIAFDASAIAGFGDEAQSDLLLRPDPDTLMLLPWRPEHGQVVRMFCSIHYPDGRPFPCDTRALLHDTIAWAAQRGFRFLFGAEQEFYLFQRDESGEPTKIPYDRAGYMDIAPDDKGENIRREICLTLARMGISPECSHHEEGPGQNEIDFKYSDPLTAADNVMTFQSIVKFIAERNGLYADFSPKPLADAPGSGFHINMSVKAEDGRDYLPQMVAGVLDKVVEMTLFLNPAEESYARFGGHKAPKYISWSHENRSQLVRIPAAVGEYRRAELRSPDPAANPYLAFALMIQAALRGMEQNLELPPAANLNLYQADIESLSRFQPLPQDRQAAVSAARSSRFIRSAVPEAVADEYFNG
ncbi:MAG: glutamine synthetase, partial [Lawsonibacter sp.]|nr:glutamine synthetase [Lawsonibacter sp.]